MNREESPVFRGFQDSIQTEDKINYASFSQESEELARSVILPVTPSNETLSREIENGGHSSVMEEIMKLLYDQQKFYFDTLNKRFDDTNKKLNDLNASISNKIIYDNEEVNSNIDYINKDNENIEEISSKIIYENEEVNNNIDYINKIDEEILSELIYDNDKGNKKGLFAKTTSSYF